MKPYAEVPARAARQVAVDLAAVVWLAVFVGLAEHARSLVLGMRAPADGMVAAGNGMTRAFAEMSNLAQLVPFVGGQLAGVLQEGQQVGQSLTDGGQQQANTLGGMASGASLLVLLVGLLPLLVLWLPGRLRYARLAGAAATTRDSGGGTDLLALHALNRLPLHSLRAISEDPAGDWRRGDPEVLRKLAALELDRLGLHVRPSDAPPG
jgi:hypothetical protein